MGANGAKLWSDMMMTSRPGPLVLALATAACSAGPSAGRKIAALAPAAELRRKTAAIAIAAPQRAGRCTPSEWIMEVLPFIGVSFVSVPGGPPPSRVLRGGGGPPVLRSVVVLEPGPQGREPRGLDRRIAGARQTQLRGR